MTPTPWPNAAVGKVELTSVTGYISFDRTYRIDVDTTPREQLDFIQRDHVQQFSQELRAATTISIADIDLIRISLRALLSSVGTLAPAARSGGR